jgi:hypothetical protein
MTINRFLHIKPSFLTSYNFLSVYEDVPPDQTVGDVQSPNARTGLQVLIG